jgi:elongation factor G
VIGLRVVLSDGQFHPVDSSDIAFQTAAQGAFRQVYMKARPQILEPIMKVSIEGPSEFAGNVFATISQRRGTIVSSIEDGTFARVDAEVPLSEMFGYSSVLRSLTQGKAEFTMEFLKYGRVPPHLAEMLTEQYLEKQRKPSPK